MYLKFHLTGASVQIPAGLNTTKKNVGGPIFYTLNIQKNVKFPLSVIVYFAKDLNFEVIGELIGVDESH